MLCEPVHETSMLSKTVINTTDKPLKILMEQQWMLWIGNDLRLGFYGLEKLIDLIGSELLA